MKVVALNTIYKELEGKKLDDAIEALTQLLNRTSIKHEDSANVFQMKNIPFNLLNSKNQTASFNSRITTTAGRLTITNDTIPNIFRSCNDIAENNNYSSRIINMGHGSIAEHSYHVFALEEVSLVLEQWLIENRLASYTIKTRRECDFRNQGFYVGDFHCIVDGKKMIHPNNEELRVSYLKHIKSNLQAYGELIDSGAPKEEARYLLNYSTYSNILFGADGRELAKITISALQSPIEEINNLGTNLFKYIEKELPEFVQYIQTELKKESVVGAFERKVEHYQSQLKSPKVKKLSKPKVLSMSRKADTTILLSALMKMYQCDMREAQKYYNAIKRTDGQAGLAQLMDAIFHDPRYQRCFEQIQMQVQIPISLAMLTHLTRQRIQGLIIPERTPLWATDYYYEPKHFTKAQKQLFDDAIKRNSDMIKNFQERGVCDNDLAHLYQAAQMCNVVSNINGRSLMHIISIRDCQKAQEPNREIWDEVIKAITPRAPLFAALLGPSCQVKGKCPEGNRTCGTKQNPRNSQKAYQKLLEQPLK